MGLLISCAEAHYTVLEHICQCCNSLRINGLRLTLYQLWQRQSDFFCARGAEEWTPGWQEQTLLASGANRGIRDWWLMSEGNSVLLCCYVAVHCCTAMWCIPRASALFTLLSNLCLKRRLKKHAELVEEARERNEARTHKTSGNRC